MHVMQKLPLVLPLVLLTAVAGHAQTSASFKLEEHVFNNGGHPADGTVLGSAGYTISLDSIGDTVARTGLSSASFSMDGGFLPAYGPPGEVLELLFHDAITLAWDAEPLAEAYNLYRNRIIDPFDPDYGACLESGIAGTGTVDADAPGPDEAWFYLVTALNRLHEEGTKGTDAAGTERPNPSPCP